MLLNLDEAMLLLVDMQDKLVELLPDAARVTQHCEWMVQLANLLEVPVLVSEQYPEGLGSTVSALSDVIQNATLMTKQHFSCVADPECLSLIEAQERRQIVLVGIESHVCVLQTAIELAERDFQVYVVADAISSREESDKNYAIARMQSLGIQIVTREMVLFEWAYRAGTETFKVLLKEFLV